jgi:hypothetical protein
VVAVANVGRGSVQAGIPSRPAGEVPSERRGYKQIPRTRRSQSPDAPTPTASKPSTGKRQPSGATAAWEQAVVNRRVGLSHADLPLRRSTAGVGIISSAAVRGECHLRSSQFTARLKDNQYSSFLLVLARLTRRISGIRTLRFGRRFGRAAWRAILVRAGFRRTDVMLTISSRGDFNGGAPACVPRALDPFGGSTAHRARPGRTRRTLGYQRSCERRGHEFESHLPQIFAAGKRFNPSARTSRTAVTYG